MSKMKVYLRQLAEYRAQLLDQAGSSYIELDRTMLFISLVELVLSFYLFTSFVSVPSLVVLSVCRVFFFLTLFFIVLGHIFSVEAFEKQIDLVDMGAPEDLNIWTLRVRILNNTTRGCFFFGVCAFIVCVCMRF